MATAFYSNQYEQAFENWLIDNRAQYVVVDQHKRAVFSRNKIKSFDFLLYPARGDREIIITEVKGRKFKGTSLSRLAGLECWVTMDDVRGLIRWEQVFGKGYAGAFVFAYEFEKIDVELNGRDAYGFDEKRYIFFGVKLDDYRTFMTVRSPKWQTVTLPAEKFRSCVVPMGELLF